MAKRVQQNSHTFYYYEDPATEAALTHSPQDDRRDLQLAHARAAFYNSAATVHQQDKDTSYAPRAANGMPSPPPSARNSPPALFETAMDFPQPAPPVLPLSHNPGKRRYSMPVPQLHNHAQAAYDSDLDDEQNALPRSAVKKRARVSRACDSCSKHKKKCDGRDPCSTCSLRRLPCTYTAQARRRGPAPGSRPAYAQYVASLEDRLAKMEEMIDAASVLSAVSDPIASGGFADILKGLGPKPERPAGLGAGGSNGHGSPEESEDDSGSPRPRDLRTPSVSSEETVQPLLSGHPGRSGQLDLELETKLAEVQSELAARTEQLRDALNEAENWKKKYLAARKSQIVGEDEKDAKFGVVGYQAAAHA